MKHRLIWMILFGLFAIWPGVSRAEEGWNIRPDCTTISSPISSSAPGGPTICWNSTTNQLTYWNGSIYVAMNGAVGAFCLSFDFEPDGTGKIPANAEARYVAAEGWSFPANFAASGLALASVCNAKTAGTSNQTFDIQVDDSSIGSVVITSGTSGATTGYAFSTTAAALEAKHSIAMVAPGTPDTTLVLSCSLCGALTP